MSTIIEISDLITVNNKVVNNKGEVAVLYSPDYGAGWYTWNLENPDMLFDPSVVHMVLESKTTEELIERVTVYATLKWPDAYIGGLDALTVRWIPQGAQFRVTEYDGNEGIELKTDTDWIIA